MTHLALIFSGKDPATFLQGQLTCDVTLCSTTSAILGALCNRKGRIISHLWLWQSGESFCMLLPEALIEHVLHALKPAAMLSRITMAPMNAPGLSLNTPNATIHLAQPLHEWAMGSNAQQPTDVAAWEQALFKHGMVAITQATTETFTPHMLHYPKLDAVSFSKGCYLGQEIIARTEYLGKTKRILRLYRTMAWLYRSCKF